MKRAEIQTCTRTTKIIQSLWTFGGFAENTTAKPTDQNTMTTDQAEQTNGSAGQNGDETRQERRARLREVAKRIAKMTDEERGALAARVSVVTIEGRSLSLHNQCLIASQNPSATIVGGFRQWIKAGRAVQKGQHGAVIWVPIGRKNKETQELEERTGFVLGSVFDVSQTAEIGGAQ